MDAGGAERLLPGRSGAALLAESEGFGPGASEAASGAFQTSLPPPPGRSEVGADGEEDGANYYDYDEEVEGDSGE
eukprot:1283090-Pyramimonas_sp.AAC.1